MGWVGFRLRYTHKPNNYLVSSNVNKNFPQTSIYEKLTFYRILQFLSFARTLIQKKF